MKRKTYLTITEAARRLGVHRQSLWERIKRGTFPAYCRTELRRMWRIKPEDVEKELENRAGTDG